MAPKRITAAQIDRTIGVLGDLTTTDHPRLDGATRDEIAHVIDVLDEISAAGGVTLTPRTVS